MEKSRRHHYLPQCFSEQFADENGKLTVYDKDKDCYFPGTPMNLFVEIDRNSLRDENGIVDDKIERMYSKIDGKFATTLHRVVETGNLSVEDLRLILFLAYSTKWRVPQYDNAFAEAKKLLTVSDLGLRVRSEGKQLAVDLEVAFNSEEKQEMKRLLLALQPFRHTQEYQKIFKNSFLLSSPIPSFIGDCPFNEYPVNTNQLFEDFVFPISKHLTLIHTTRVAKEDLTKALERGDYDSFIGAFSRARDCSILFTSERFVACADRLYLKDIVDIYKTTKARISSPDLIQCAVFEVLHNYGTYLHL